jgi:tRNA-intron endonuclease, archaea type
MTENNVPENESETRKEVEIVNGIFKNGKVIVEPSLTSHQLHQNNYFGSELSDKSIELEIMEALLLLERSRIIISDVNGKNINAEELLKASISSDEKIWVKYLVYRDIRQRGYMVRFGIGDGIDFRVFPRGAIKSQSTAKHFIFILSEGNPVDLEKLDKISQQTIASRKELVLAIVDRLGEPTYYTLEQFKLPENKEISSFF